MTPKRQAKRGAPPVKSTFKPARAPATPVERKIMAYVRRKNPAMMEIVFALRILIKKTIPKSHELLNPWGLPTYEWRGAIGYIMVGKKHVTFGLARGSELPDPAKLLEGTGKNLRHVKIRDKAQLVDANLRDLLLSALSLNRRDPQKSRILPARENVSDPAIRKEVSGGRRNASGAGKARNEGPAASFA
jgi:hypothetical protein